MKITIHGAGGGEVTGSAYLVQTREANVLVDFGLFQGARKIENHNRIPKKGAFEKLNAVVLTHAHLDHTGRLPLLTRAGYAGPIYATPATIDFADLILKDSAICRSRMWNGRIGVGSRWDNRCSTPFTNSKTWNSCALSTRSLATTNLRCRRLGSPFAPSRQATCLAR